MEANSAALVAAISGLTAAEGSLGSESRGSAAGMEALVAAAGRAAGMASRSYGAFGLLTHEVQLFGGALGDMHMMGQITLWC